MQDSNIDEDRKRDGSDTGRRRPEFSNKEEHLVTGEDEKTEEKRYKNIRERETERERIQMMSKIYRVRDR